eukprot:m.502700 g.502700  ORF g.502700 m.502700 type:complete len:462 (-) comp57340_c0_seq10:161-1546(-)
MLGMCLGGRAEAASAITRLALGAGGARAVHGLVNAAGALASVVSPCVRVLGRSRCSADTSAHASELGTREAAAAIRTTSSAAAVDAETKILSRVQIALGACFTVVVEVASLADEARAWADELVAHASSLNIFGAGLAAESSGNDDSARARLGTLAAGNTARGVVGPIAQDAVDRARECIALLRFRRWASALDAAIRSLDEMRATTSVVAALAALRAAAEVRPLTPDAVHGAGESVAGLGLCQRRAVEATILRAGGDFTGAALNTSGAAASAGRPLAPSAHNAVDRGQWCQGASRRRAAAANAAQSNVHRALGGAGRQAAVTVAVAVVAVVRGAMPLDDGGEVHAVLNLPWRRGGDVRNASGKILEVVVGHGAHGVLVAGEALLGADGVAVTLAITAFGPAARQGRLRQSSTNRGAEHQSRLPHTHRQLLQQQPPKFFSLAIERSRLRRMCGWRWTAQIWCG